MNKLLAMACIFLMPFTMPINVNAPVTAEDVLFEEQERFASLVYDDEYYVELDEDDVDILCKVLCGEAGGIDSDTEKAAVVWCILNRVDSARFPDTIAGVVTEPCQFDGYSEDCPVRDDLKEIVIDVLRRWNAEKDGYIMTGRVLPKEYLYFMGDGAHNHFTIEWGGSYEWGWNAFSPYEN